MVLVGYTKANFAGLRNKLLSERATCSYVGALLYYFIITYNGRKYKKEFI